MKKIVLSLTALAIFVLTFSSCRTSGYGCKGRESWGGMVKRINRAY
jgi:hypothetical protein